jgi:hypothetical protein
LEYKIKPTLKIKIHLLLLLLLHTVQAYSQSTTPNSADIFEDPDNIPVDQAIVLLAIAGAGIGVFRLYRKENSKKE